MKAAEQLSWNMKVTSACRFGAEARLKRRVKMYSVGVSAYSVILIVLSLVTLVFPIDAYTNKIVGSVGLVASIILLAATASGGSNRDAVRAERLHGSAVAIARIKRRFDSISAPNDSDVLHFSEEYDACIERTNDNHDDIDYKRYRLDHPNEFKDLQGSSTTSIKLESLALNFSSSAITGVVIIAGGVLASILAASPQIFDAIKSFLR